MAKKRYLLCGLLLTGFLIPVVQGSHPGGSVIHAQQVHPRSGVVEQRDEEKPRYLLIYTTTEKCYECPFRTAMVCADNNPGCNVPAKTIYHTLFFNSLEKLLARMNEERKMDAYGFLSRIKWVRITPGNFVGVYREIPRLLIQVKVGAVEAEVMRPVRVKRDKKEWRLREE